MPEYELFAEFASRFCFVMLANGRVPISTRRIRTVSFEVLSARSSVFSFLKDYCLWETFLSKVFIRHFVSAISEQLRMMVISFHVGCLRGGNCTHLLLNTVLLLSTDSILPFSFQRRRSSLLESQPILLSQPFHP